MDRRDFMKTLGVAGGSVGASGALATLLGSASGLSAGPAAAEAAMESVPSRSRDAMFDLLDAMRETQAMYLRPELGTKSADRVAEGQRALLHILWTGMHHYLEADPERPVFKPYVTPYRKLLGDNPDSLYYFAPIRDDRSYRVRGNVGAATFTSFTIEQGSEAGHAARGSIAAISDRDMEIAPDGSFELTVSPKRPKSGNWLELGKGGAQITTRHYHETFTSIAAIPGARIDLSIEPLDPAPLQPWGGDGEVAERIGWVANFVRDHARISLPGRQKGKPAIDWFSDEPNVIGPPGQWLGSQSAYGNTHAWYAAGLFALAPDEALVIEGRFPPCNFANVVLWNHNMQSFDFMNRNISFNRKQVRYEKDGSFRMVIAHEDPGVPNWLDSEGRQSGQIYWRYVFPTEQPKQVKTKVVKASKLG